MTNLHGDQSPNDPNAAGTLSAQLFELLTADVDVTLPSIDLSSPDFVIPDLDDVSAGGSVSSLTEADLTDRTVNGAGMFDGLMVSLNAHLKQEYERSRITGAEYAKAYIALTTAAMSSAVQYLLQRDQVYWNAMLTKRQAQLAQVSVIKSRVELEETKVRLAIANIQAQTNLSDYALSKMRLSTESMNYELAHVQLHQGEYTLDNILPLQKAGLEAENQMKTAQVAQVQFETTQMMPAQLTGIQADNEVKAQQVLESVYKVEYLLPAELTKITAENALTGAQVDKIGYEVASLLPAQLTGIEADNAVKAQQVLESEFRVGFVLPAELEGIQADIQVKGAQKLNVEAETSQLTSKTAQIVYETNTMLPAQKLGIDADTSAKLAQKDQTLYETSAILPAQKQKLDAEKGLLVYQLSDLLPAQVAGHTADTATKIYTNQFLLPAQLASTREQTESHRAKTLDTRTDGTVVSGGMGIQKKLYEQQIESYKRDAEQKVAKMLLDGWITQKTMDEGLTAPTSLQNQEINEVFSLIRQKLQLAGV